MASVSLSTMSTVKSRLELILLLLAVLISCICWHPQSMVDAFAATTIVVDNQRTIASSSKIQSRMKTTNKGSFCNLVLSVSPSFHETVMDHNSADMSGGPRNNHENSSHTSPTTSSLTLSSLLEQQSSHGQQTTTKNLHPIVFHFNKLLIDSVYQLICTLYPVTGTTRDYARFYILETVARVPYFAYLSVLHLRETFGERFDEMSDRMRCHYAEADNELHHLLIMEELGGNELWIDRCIAQSVAFVYFWYVVLVYMWNEPAAYHLSELIEDHAYNTYDKFLNDHETKLRTMPVPEIARKYYEHENPYMFDLFCTVQDQDHQAVLNNEHLLYKSSSSNIQPNQKENTRGQQQTKRLNTLYDVFCCIRNDEKEHWKTLCNLVQYDNMNGNVIDLCTMVDEFEVDVVDADDEILLLDCSNNDNDESLHILKVQPTRPNYNNK